MPTEKQIESAYQLARERYAELGVDTEQAMQTLAGISLSLHCWQGDDVGGFENAGGRWAGGWRPRAITPARRAIADELRADLDGAYSLIPGSHRLNLHAMYAETGGRQVERSQVRPEHFRAWVGLGQSQPSRPGLQPHLASHTPRPPAVSPSPATMTASALTGWSTASPAARSGRISGRRSARPASPTSGSRMATRTRPSTARPRACCCAARWTRSSAEKIDPRFNLDAVEGKLFGHRLGELRDRLARVLPGLCRLALGAADAGRGPLPPHRDGRG